MTETVSGKSEKISADTIPPNTETLETPAQDTTVPPGSRKVLAEAAVRRFSYFAAGAGVIPLPGLDLVAIIGVELKMLRDVGRIYGVAFDEIRARAILGALLGGILPVNAAAGIRALFTTVYRSIPGVGAVMNLLVMPATAAASNYALGQLFIEHFEHGGTFLDIDEKAMAAQFRAKTSKVWRRPAAT
jgi:uncharacterized protein (DUF697 family)